MGPGQVPVVAGFQGIGPLRDRVTTLGRGGSDLSAVALAAAVKADRCDIYTDVDGVYTTDPRIVPRARKLERISYEEMLELASVGAKVLQTRSVELAMKQRVRVQVLSSFEDKPGSLVVDEDEIVEQPLVSGIAYSRDDAKVTLRRVPDRPGIAASVFGALSAANVNVDMIVQNIGADGTTDMTFTVGKADLAAGAGRAGPVQRASSATRRCWPTRRWRRSAWSASACAATRAWPTPCSGRWRRRASTSRSSRPARSR